MTLHAYFKTTYRGVLEFLAVSPTLQERLGLMDKLPHFTTLQKFSGRRLAASLETRVAGKQISIITTVLQDSATASAGSVAQASEEDFFKDITRLWSCAPKGRQL